MLYGQNRTEMQLTNTYSTVHEQHYALTTIYTQRLSPVLSTLGMGCS